MVWCRWTRCCYSSKWIWSSSVAPPSLSPPLLSRPLESENMSFVAHPLVGGWVRFSPIFTPILGNFGDKKLPYNNHLKQLFNTPQKPSKTTLQHSTTKPKTILQHPTTTPQKHPTTPHNNPPKQPSNNHPKRTQVQPSWRSYGW